MIEFISDVITREPNKDRPILCEICMEPVLFIGYSVEAIHYGDWRPYFEGSGLGYFSRKDYTGAYFVCSDACKTTWEAQHIK